MKYIDTQTGYTLTDDELYEIVDECITLDVYEEVVNDNECPVRLFNNERYEMGRVLRAVDPIYFSALRDEYVEFTVSEFKHGYESEYVHVRIERD